MKMIDDKPKLRRNGPAQAESRWIQRGILGAACLLVIGVYAFTAHSAFLASTSLNTADTCYNLLVQGFRAGQLSLKKDVPPGFAQLADPYDPTANVRYRFAPYRMHDLTYYKGRLYLDFGVTPAVVLFWPYVALTGHYLSQEDAGVIFCAIGFLASVGLLCALWRRHFAAASVALVATCVLALGFTTLVPVMLARCDVYEVAISCGYMLTMLALAAIWKALHEPERRAWWLAAASLAFGLAVGARPNLLFGAAILLVPVIRAWRDRLVVRTRHERRKIGALLMAATGPIILIGLALMLYNTLRFGNPFEFGKHYVLREVRQATQQFFSPRYFWFNFRVFFLEPARWSGRFPFLRENTMPALPPGHWPAETPFSILPNIPLVWLALAVPLAWRRRSAEARSILCGFLVVAALLGGTCALTICFWCGATVRYEVEFLPALVLLAVIGILGCEHALAPTSESGPACRPVWRRAARWGWGLLLGFSVAFNLLASIEHYAEAHYNLGNVLLHQGKEAEAIAHYEQALRLNPDYAEAYNNLGIVLMDQGRVPEAMAHFEQAVRIKPDHALAHNNLGNALLQSGRIQEAIQQYEQVLRIRPDLAEAHFNMGNALTRVGRLQDAVEHYEQTVRIKPDNAEAHNRLGNALMQTGRMQEAIAHFEQALRLKPDSAEVHDNLGVALEQTGNVPEAIKHYEQALQIKPDFTQAQNALARLHAGQ